MPLDKISSLNKSESRQLGIFYSSHRDVLGQNEIKATRLEHSKHFSMRRQLNFHEPRVLSPRNCSTSNEARVVGVFEHLIVKINVLNANLMLHHFFKWDPFKTTIK